MRRPLLIDLPLLTNPRQKKTCTSSFLCYEVISNPLLHTKRQIWFRGGSLIIGCVSLLKSAKGSVLARGSRRYSHWETLLIAKNWRTKKLEMCMIRTCVQYQGSQMRSCACVDSMHEKWTNQYDGIIYQHGACVNESVPCEVVDMKMNFRAI